MPGHTRRDTCQLGSVCNNMIDTMVAKDRQKS